MYFSGGTIIIDHGYGLTSAFLHLKSLSVKKGQRVKRGQTIGTIGSTGRSTGPHLDWRINLFKRRLDPALIMPPMPNAAAK
ncbi:MAG: M23 family metallopeptidase [Alphaproteobacteria bacterium]